MDALVKNRCEFQLLKLMNEVATILDIDLDIEIQAIKEGGVREIFKFLNKKKNKPYLLTTIYFLGILSSVIINIASDQLTKDTEQEDLNKEESRLRIKKLNKELNESNSNITQDTISQIIPLIASDHKIRVFKSRFYTALLEEPQVYQVSATEMRNDQVISSSEHVISREAFTQQIIPEEDIEIQVIENAYIEIVSPVLKLNDMKWRAIYNGKHITFELKDTEFKNAVLNKQYSFSNGTAIRCKLAFKTGVNEMGVFQTKDFTVFDVLEVYDGLDSKPTPRLKRMKEIANQSKFKF